MAVTLPSRIDAEAVVPDELAGARFDQAAARMFSSYSRERLKQWIRAEQLLLNGHAGESDARVRGGDVLRIRAVPVTREDWQSPQDVPFVVAHIDERVIVVDKPVGLVMHPGAGTRDGTLVNGLLFRYPELNALPRAGIVHRLDKETSGLLIVGRTLDAHTWFVRALAARAVERRYLVIVRGEVLRPFSVDAPIGRHPTLRTRMAVRTEGGRAARTDFVPLHRVAGATLLEARLHSGRTHQIRVHLGHARYPLLGDTVYGIQHPGITRQALHAYRLAFPLVPNGQLLEVRSKPPADFLALVESLGIVLDV